MSHNSSGETVLFRMIMLLVVAGIIVTLVGDIWFHWLALGLAILVSCWVRQSMGKTRVPRDRK